jgi:hypothetical protein
MFTAVLWQQLTQSTGGLVAPDSLRCADGTATIQQTVVSVHHPFVLGRLLVRPGRHACGELGLQPLAHHSPVRYGPCNACPASVQWPSGGHVGLAVLDGRHVLLYVTQQLQQAGGVLLSASGGGLDASWAGFVLDSAGAQTVAP